MCSGATFQIANEKIEVSQYGGYYGGKLTLDGAINLSVNHEMPFSDIKKGLKESGLSKDDAIAIIAGIVKYSDE